VTPGRRAAARGRSRPTSPRSSRERSRRCPSSKTRSKISRTRRWPS
jgi:hypothetical protein